MKYAAYGLLAAFFALGVYGAIPDSAKGWYTPSRFDTQNSAGVVSYFDEDGLESTIAISVDAAGVIQDDASAYIELGLSRPAYEAMKVALQSKTIAKQNTERIETIGKNLYDLTRKTGIRITNPQTGQSYTIDFGGSIASAVSGSAGAIPATSSEGDPADNISLGWHDGKLGVSGWHTQSPIRGVWAEASPSEFDIPVRTAVGAAMYYRRWYGVDGISLSENSATHKLELSGWRSRVADAPSLAEVIVKGDKDFLDRYELVARYGPAGNLAYVPIGTIKPGIDADGESIVTNEAGVASLYGWEDAAGGSIPRKGAETLEWTPPAELVDGASLAWSADRKKYEVAGAGIYAGNHANHYFGTSANGAALGWHELPNVTTNAVYGDEATISSTVGANSGVKILGLRGWNYAHPQESDPLLVVNNGGEIGYLAPSNLAASCSCSNDWENLAWWLGFNGTMDDIFVDYSTIYESMSDFMEFDFGVLRMYGTGTEYRFHSALFDSSKPVASNFTAPTNWADGASISMTQSGAYQIRGFDAARACNADMGAMLSNPSGSDARTHLLLAKKTDTGELHYVPIGQGVSSGVKADGASIVTNTAGEAHIGGYPAAQFGAIPFKTNGGIEWTPAAESTTLAVPALQAGNPPALAYLGESIKRDLNHNLNIAGFADAPNLAVPQKTGGSLTWQTNITASVKVAASNNIVTTSVEWLGSAGSDGNGANAYSIRIQRGRLAVNANGEIYVAQDDSLTQYIRTTPHSAETGN